MPKHPAVVSGAKRKPGTRRLVRCDECGQLGFIGVMVRKGDVWHHKDCLERDEEWGD